MESEKTLYALLMELLDNPVSVEERAKAIQTLYYSIKNDHSYLDKILPDRPLNYPAGVIFGEDYFEYLQPATEQEKGIVIVAKFDGCMDLTVYDALKQKATYGMQLVGYKFNPSGNPKVDEVKRKCAELIDEMYYGILTTDNEGEIHIDLARQAINQMILSQMSLVKALTRVRP